MTSPVHVISGGRAAEELDPLLPSVWEIVLIGSVVLVPLLLAALVLLLVLRRRRQE